MKFDPDNHVIGKVYDLTQENFNALLKDWERLRSGRKPEEDRFIAFVKAHDGQIPSDLWGGITKQEYTYLEKWSRKGWWDYGVSLRSGSLNKEGRRVFGLPLDPPSK